MVQLLEDSAAAPVLEGGFWMDSIKTHCYATFDGKEAAEKAMAALQGLQWPPQSFKKLEATMGDMSAAEVRECMLASAWRKDLRVCQELVVWQQTLSSKLHVMQQAVVAFYTKLRPVFLFCLLIFDEHNTDVMVVTIVTSCCRATPAGSNFPRGIITVSCFCSEVVCENVQGVTGCYATRRRPSVVA